MNTEREVVGLSEEEIYYWRSQIVRQKESGLSRQAYCQKEGINYRQLLYWSGELGCDAKERLLPVQLKAEAIEKFSEGVSGVDLLCTLNMKEGHCLQFHTQIALEVLLGKIL